jgi:hypothetical protein
MRRVLHALCIPLAQLHSLLPCDTELRETGGETCSLQRQEQVEQRVAQRAAGTAVC